MKTNFNQLALLVCVIFYQAAYSQVLNRENNKLPKNNQSGTAFHSVNQGACPVYDDTIFYTNKNVCEGSTTILTAPAGFASYSWSDAATTDKDTVGPGTYTLTVTDANGCAYTTPSVTVNQYPPVKPAIITNGATTFCNGDSVVMSVSGGNISSIHWSTGEVTTFIIVKAQGNYTVTTVHAQHGCTATSNPTFVTVNQPTSSDTTVAVCGSFTWNNTTYKRSGDYTYTTTNSKGCDSIAALHLTIITISSTFTKTDAKCYGSATGDITVNPTSGFPPYTYRIGTQGSYGSSNTFSNLKAGNYRVSISDAAGCGGVTTQIAILQDPALTGTYTHQNPLCKGSATGSLTITPTSGVPPFTYRLGSNGAFGSNNTFNNLKAGTYKVTIADAAGCQGTVSNIVITDAAALTATFAITDVTCYGQVTGAITVTPTSGTLPYSYKFGTTGTFGSSNSFSNLRAGSYFISIKDGNNCVTGSRQTVTQPVPIKINITKTDESCPAAKDGSISATGSNGVAPYKFRFGSTGNYDTVSMFNNLKAGNYRVYINDANNCSGGSAGVSIIQLSKTCFAGAPISKTVLPGQESRRLEFGATLWPNPTTSMFTLQVNTGQKQAIQIKVSDVNGRTLYTSQGEPGQLFKFGEALATGMYLVEIRQGDQIKTIKALKIK